MDRPAGPASRQIACGVAITVPLLLRIHEPDWALIRRADYFGIALLATSPGSLEYALEEGPRGNWLTGIRR